MTQISPQPELSAERTMAGPEPVPTRPQSDRRLDPLKLPETVDRLRICWSVALTLITVHTLALTAAVPWLFTWSALALMLAGLYVFGTLGINVCYHRLLTHRSFRTPRWFERLLTLLAFCNLQGSSIRWVAAHRMHHQHSDHRPDPHSPLVNFLWSHVGWLMIRNRGTEGPVYLNRYAADLVRDRFHRLMESRQAWLLVWAAHVLLFAAGGFAFGWFTGGVAGGLRTALSWLVWGVMVRTVVVWHITWSINSVTHIWGYRNYQTNDDSRNNWLLGYISMGEGWHNNHHADQRSAAHGHRWWELDLSYLTILLLKRLGLAWQVATPRRHRGTRLDPARKAIDGGPPHA